MPRAPAPGAAFAAAFAAALPAAAAEGMPQLDASTFPSQVFWLAVLFAVLYGVMGKLVIPRISGVREDRHHRIQGDLDRAQEMREEAEAALRDYENRLAEARAEGERIVRAALDEAARRARAENDRLAKELAAEVAEAEARIEAARGRAWAEAEEAARGLAAGLAAAVTGRAPEDARVAEAVAGALERRR